MTHSLPPHRAADRYRAGKRLWAPDEEAQLCARYPHEPTAEIARDLRRSLTATYAHAAQLGLAKTAAYLASPAACRLRRPEGPDHPGFRTQFKLGHVPANKGPRRPGWFRGRMRDTQFKPGHRQRWMPVGSTRLIDGYVYRKVSDTPKVPYTVNWKPEHHLIWTRVHGPVPKGHALAFKNSDRMDLRLDNLECVPRRELMWRNSVHRLPRELAEAVQLLGALNRKVRRERRGGEKQDSGFAGSPVRDAGAAEGR